MARPCVLVARVNAGVGACAGVVAGCVCHMMQCSSGVRWEALRAWCGTCKHTHICARTHASHFAASLSPSLPDELEQYNQEGDESEEEEGEDEDEDEDEGEGAGEYLEDDGLADLPGAAAGGSDHDDDGDGGEDDDDEYAGAAAA